MKKNIAACGLDCSECEAFIATMNGDDKARAEIALKWSEIYGGKCLPEDCICEGCMADGLLSTAHANTCEIRRCATERGIQHCGLCEDFACEKLEQFFEFVPDMRERLESMHSEKI